MYDIFEHTLRRDRSAVDARFFCPNCTDGLMTNFYSVENVPVHSNLMQQNELDARAFPRGDIELALCDKCGFISNTAYDPVFKNYSPIYEDQQSFSQTFNSFSQQLVDHLIKKHNLVDKEVIEIGCGKGDFLVQLCEQGDNHGIGIDPAIIHNRVDHGDRVRFIQDYYTAKYEHLKADVYICRHTLEHIYETHAFLQTIRRSIGKRDALVFFEVPDVIRVLKERAFWDVYYEHCSYFSPGSLARLFRRCFFKVTDLWLGYENQYLLIEARSVDEESPDHDVLEESFAQLKNEVNDYATYVTVKQEKWKSRLAKLRHENKKIAFWGSGSKCVAFLTTLKSDQVDCIVDINPHRHGKYIPGVGLKVSSPEMLISFKPDVVIIMNSIYKQEINKDLCEMGLKPQLLCL